MSRERLLYRTRVEYRGARYEALGITRPIYLRTWDHPVDSVFARWTYHYPSGRVSAWTALHRDGEEKNARGRWDLRIIDGVDEADIDELRRIDRLDRSPDDLATLSALGWPNDSWHPITLAVATIAVPSAGIRASDVLVHARAGEDQVRAIRGRVHGLSLSDYEALRRAVKEHDDALRDITPLSDLLVGHKGQSLPQRSAAMGTASKTLALAAVRRAAVHAHGERSSLRSERRGCDPRPADGHRVPDACGEGRCAMSVLKFARWFHYTGTRQLVRGWKFVDDYEPLNVTAGQCLFEDEDGFEVRDADASVASVRHIEDWQVEPLLAEAGTPAWDDVAELYERAVEVVKDFADVLVKTTEHPNLWETLKEHLDDAMNDAKVHDSIAAKHRQRLANTPNARHQ